MTRPAQAHSAQAHSAHTHSAQAHAAETRSAERHLRWPADRFYWALLDASVIPGTRRPSAAQLGYLLEPFVPLPLEELHAVFVRLDRGQYLACALPCEDLDVAQDGGVPANPNATANATANALTLTPAALPAFADARVDPAQLNLLTGPYTPAPVRRLRQRVLLRTAALGVACALLVALGFERRIGAARAQLGALAEATQSVYREALGSAASRGTLPPELQLTSEWRALRQTRTRAVPQGEPDAALSLSRLLALWPRRFSPRTQSVLVSPEAIHLDAELPDAAAAQEVTAALEPLADWDLQQPSVRHLAGAVSLGLHYRRRGALEGGR